MGLKRYEVTVEGRHPHKTTLLLSDEDAKRMGVADQHAEKPAAKGRRAASNKSRTPANKRGAAAKPAEPAAEKPAESAPADEEQE